MAKNAKSFSNSLVGESDGQYGRNVIAIPFLVVAVVAEASLLLSPNTNSGSATIVSVILLATAVASFFLFLNKTYVWVNILVPLLYTGSVVSLVIATGSSSSGVGLVMLLSVVWSALYLEIWQSSLIVAVVVVSEFVTSIVPVEVDYAIRVRRVVMFLLISSLIVYAAHEVRNRVTRITTERKVLSDGMQLTIGALEESLRNAAILGHLVDMLNSSNTREEGYEVIQRAAETMFVDGGLVSAFNSSSNQVETKCAWGSFAGECEVFSTEDCWALRRGHEYESKSGEIKCNHLRKSGVQHTLCRPLLAQGEVMGVLTISMPYLVVPIAEIAGIDDPLPQTAMLFGEQLSIWMANFNLRETLRYQSIRDPLTNLFNRRFLEESLTREMSKSARTLEQVSVIQVDIDNFKEINDKYGHSVGDVTLVAIAEVILSLFRDSDVPCRSGGEEFTMLLPNCSWENAHARSEELQRRVAEIQVSTSPQTPMLKPPTLSIGIAASPEHGFTSDALLRSADLALYESKSGGRNKITRALAVTDDRRPVVEPELRSH